MGINIYLTRPNKETEADEDDIKRFEKSAISNFNLGNRVYLIEKFPKKFFQLATKIRIEKASEHFSSLSEQSNSMLFKVFLTNNIC